MSSWTFNEAAPAKDIIARVHAKVESYSNQNYLDGQALLIEPFTQLVLDNFKPTDDQQVAVNVSVGGNVGTAINVNVVIS